VILLWHGGNLLPFLTDVTWSFFIIKPTRCTNFTNLSCHKTVHVSDSSSVHHQEFIHCTLSNGMSYRQHSSRTGMELQFHPSGVPRGEGVFKPPAKFRRYWWSPRLHDQEELASRFPFVVHCVLIRL